MSRLAHSVLGHGSPFVWAHGLTSSRAGEEKAGLFDWTPVTERGRRVVRFDARGHGRTGGPTDAGAYRWPQLAVDLLSLLDELDIGRTSAGGASMGCATVLHAAIRAPERFDRLVLVVPPTAWETRAAQAELYEGSARYVEQAGKAAWIAVAAAAPRPEIFAGLPEVPFDADIPEELLPFVLRGAAASDLPPPEAVATIARPSLVLAWAGDPGHPVSTAERLVELLPDSELHVANSIPDVLGWRRLVADFLGGP
ncbi:MAG: alpha/beta hydrolase [Acidimicrobiia bacterium]|nr:alpha/beta hydrolase [Acidimicrobiia bacterium]